jgi:serine/threonine protein phosphatase PrpC
VIDQARARASWAHLGDSRIYLFRAGAVLHASRDHSLVQQLIDGGLAAAGACRDHPQRHLLLAAVGAEGGVPPAVTAAVELLPGDALLVCSDGLWEWIDEAAMLAALPDSGRSEDWLASMCGAAATAAGSRPDSARDNFSAYAIRVHAGEGAA